MKSSEKVIIVYFDRKYVYTSHNGVVPNLLKLEHILSLKLRLEDQKTEVPCHSRCGTIKIPP